MTRVVDPFLAEKFAKAMARIVPEYMARIVPEYMSRVPEYMERGAPAGSPPAIAVAVSGGGDSMALALLLDGWLAARGGGRLKAYTVDHGLRLDSRAEAEAAGRALAAHGIDHEILTWTAEKPATQVQARARRARYRLLAEACRRDGFNVLAVAHNREDQIETFWMRLAHGSGLDGLAAMAPRREMHGLALIRPLLDFGRAELRDVCRAAGLAWAEDPSNKNEKFLRARLRGFEEALAAEGLTPQRLAQTLQKLEDARTALAAVTEEAMSRLAVLHPEGFATLDRQALLALPPELARRVLAGLLQRVAPAPYPPGAEVLQRLHAALAAADFSGQTAAGCEVAPEASGAGLLVLRERAAMAPPLAVGAAGNYLWDGRFELMVPEGAGIPESRPFLALGPLGEAGVASLRKQAAENAAMRADFDALPGKVRSGLPALWQGENLLSVPHLSWVSAAAPSWVRGVRVVFRASPEAASGAGEIVSPEEEAI